MVEWCQSDFLAQGVSFNKREIPRKTHEVFSNKVLAARKSNLITAHARENKRTARLLANARKDHSTLLIQSNQALHLFVCLFLQ